MNFKKIRRAALIFLSAAAVVGSAALSGCQIKTDYPEAKITIEFNSETYVLEYTLHRNKYPQTVQHFIELADSDFYNNTIIHNYTTNDWFGGGYSYDADRYAVAADDEGGMGDYLATSSKEDAYASLFKSGAITPTVYKNMDANGNLTQALSTLIGEFSKNDHSVLNGALTSKKGALRMYYNAKDENSGNTVFLDKTSTNQILEHDYRYNCATSLFAIQAGTSSSLTTGEYCIFAYLKDNDLTALKDLQDAISDYITDYLDGSNASFALSVENVSVDVKDEMGENDRTASYTVTKLPIVIKSVDITKY